MKNANGPTVIYHANCPDGMAAAWAVKHARPDAELLPLTYDDPLPFEALDGRRVVMVDISWPLEQMVMLTRVVRSLELYDHHESAVRRLLEPGLLERIESTEHRFGLESLHPDLARKGSGLVAAVLDLDKSGAGLAWEAFHEDAPAPWWLEHVEDYDLWRFDFPETKEVCAFIHSLPKTFEAYDWFHRSFDVNRGLAVTLGQKHIERTEAITSVFCDQADIVYWRIPALRSPSGLDLEFKTAVVQAPAFLASSIGDRLRKDESLDLVAIWNWSEDEESLDRKVSLRVGADALARGVNASRVAEVYGGGGHAGAAGFTAPKLPWEA